LVGCPTKLLNLEEKIMFKNKLLALALVITSLVVAFPSSSLAGAKMHGKIVKTERENAIIHTYVSSAEGTLETSHIVETANKLVIIDAQFLRSNADELKDYAESLGKPVDRIIITHSHPDHWFGLERFKDVPIHALPETIGEITTLGDIIIQSKKPILGDLVTDITVVPEAEITEGKTVIDGLTYKFEKITDAEAGIQLLIKFPEINVLIAQDLVYNKVHLFIGQNTANNWQKVISELNNTKNYDVILAGHGAPASTEVYDRMLAYLDDVKTVLAESKTPEGVKNELMKKYPDYRGGLLIDISNSFLFAEK